jgi:arsenate reductase-like glutaredoxin family protein
VIQLIFDHPTLLHRPFFITKTKAVLAKPPQNILEIL